MSFANKLLRYLESRKGEWTRYLILKGKRPEDMDETKISTDAETVKQVYYHKRGVGIPDKIKITPIDVEAVEIGMSDGFTFYVSKNRKVRIRYADYRGMGLSKEKEKELMEKARELGYEVIGIEITDV